MKYPRILSKMLRSLTYGASTLWARSRLHEGTDIYSWMSTMCLNGLKRRRSPQMTPNFDPFLEIPSDKSKVHIEVLSVLWGNRLPIPDGSLPLSRYKGLKTKQKRCTRFRRVKFRRGVRWQGVQYQVSILKDLEGHVAADDWWIGNFSSCTREQISKTMIGYL
ncbi:hypothetical protein Tco_0931977 [Tanacetum coccineum]